MAQYKEIIYMVLDELKTISDDRYFEEEHILFLMDKYRAFLLKQRYADIKKQMPESNYQTICLDLMEVPAIAGIPCEGGSYLRSVSKIPYLMQVVQPNIYPLDYYQGDIAYVSRDRMKYVGYNRFLKDIIYASMGPNNYLYFRSSNLQYLHLEKVKMTGIFQNTQEAFNLRCPVEGNESDTCDIRDSSFPMEDALVPPLIELIVKELSMAVYKPEDNENNSKDDLSGAAVKK